MAQGTLVPWPKFTGFSDAGAILAGGLVDTFAAGTSTPLATYSDVGLTTPNANPVVLDAAGRATIYLSSASYKFVVKTSASVTVYSQDNIAAVPLTAGDNDITGTAGEAFTAGQLAYLSDGSGSLTAGRWYLADADLTYASVTPMIAFAVDAIALAASGTFRLAGRMTGLSGLVAGTNYYVSATAGAVTATQPGNSRFVGQADSTTTMVVAPNPAVVDFSVTDNILATQSFS